MSEEGLSRRRVLRGMAAGAALGGAGTVGADPGNGKGPTRHIVGTTGHKAAEKARGLAKGVHRELSFGAAGGAVVGEFPEQALSALQNRPDVRYVEPDGRMRKLGQTTPWGVDRVDADEADADGFGGAGADVAIIDTGIDSDHPDLQANLGSGKAYVSCDDTCSGNDCLEPWDDDDEHGTHCAGIAAAVDDGEDVVGVAPDVTLHAVKVLACDGYGYYSDIAAGIEYAADQGWDVASLSLGGDTSSTTLQDACQYAADQGTLVVAAAGNDGCSDCVLYPAAYDTVVAVGATNEYDSLASYSSTGPELELAAPGTSVLSTVPGGLGTLSGTSMATPHVAGGGAALMAEGDTASEARTRLGNTAEDIGLSAEESGNGLLDMQAATTATNKTMIGEAGTVSVDENWQTVTTDGSYTDPVVVTSVGTFNGSQPVHARVRNTTSDSFDVRLEEWAYQDGGHVTEELNYFVFKQGSHATDIGVDVYAGTVTVDGSGWTTVDFTPGWSAQSYVYAQVQTVNDSTPVTTRVTEFGNGTFDIICQEEDANRSGETSDHAAETVGFIATQPDFGGTGEPGESVASTFVTDEWATGSLEDSYSETPVTVHRMQSYFGRDTTGLRARNQTTSGFEVMAQEEQSSNAETNHVREYVATLASESGPIGTE